MTDAHPDGPAPGSGDRAVASAAERAKLTSSRNIPTFDDLPLTDILDLGTGTYFSGESAEIDFVERQFILVHEDKAGGKPERTPDRLSPRRSAFSGGPDTMARMEEYDPAPEMNMTYKMNKHASTKVTLNQQDENSPLYLPGGKSDSINGAGVYMDVDVKKDLQVRFGGEYQEVEGARGSQEERAQGASVGLRWSF